jgi:hypothetical protein
MLEKILDGIIVIVAGFGVAIIIGAFYLNYPGL